MNAIGGAVRALAEHPEQRAVLVEHPDLIPGLITGRFRKIGEWLVWKS